MEKINKFKSFCGKIFDTAEECIRYEKISRKVNTILDKYPKEDDIKFQNGHGYLQHTPGTKKELIEHLLILSNEWFKDEGEPFIVFNYYLGRIIDDSGMSALNKMTYKIMCIDEEEREWGQPYYAIHPQEGKQIQLN